VGVVLLKKDRKPYSAEALSWLEKNGNKHALAGNYFGTTDNATAAVKKLYAAGAVRVEVWVGYVEAWRTKKDGGDYSDTLFVYGPSGSQEKRKELTKVVRSLFVPAEDGTEADPGEGPEYQLWWD
jgi:hypothetical protein